MEKPTLNKKTRTTQSKDEKKKHSENNPKINYKKEDKQIIKENISKTKYASISNEKNSSRLKIKGNNLVDVRKIAMKLVSNTLANKYSSNSEDHSDGIVEALICNKNCNVVAIFKDYMIYDFVDEFLKRLLMK